MYVYMYIYYIDRQIDRQIEDRQIDRQIQIQIYRFLYIDIDLDIDIQIIQIYISLQIPDSHYEKKDTQNEHKIAHFEYVFTCHLSKTVWFTENFNEIKFTYYEKIFSHIRKKCSRLKKGLGIKNIFLSH